MDLGAFHQWDDKYQGEEYQPTAASELLTLAHQADLWAPIA